MGLIEKLRKKLFNSKLVKSIAAGALAIAVTTGVMTGCSGTDAKIKGQIQDNWNDIVLTIQGDLFEASGKSTEQERETVFVDKIISSELEQDSTGSKLKINCDIINDSVTKRYELTYENEEDNGASIKNTTEYAVSNLDEKNNAQLKGLNNFSEAIKNYLNSADLINVDKIENSLSFDFEDELNKLKDESEDELKNTIENKINKLEYRTELAGICLKCLNREENEINLMLMDNIMNYPHNAYSKPVVTMVGGKEISVSTTIGNVRYLLNLKSENGLEQEKCVKELQNYLDNDSSTTTSLIETGCSYELVNIETLWANLKEEATEEKTLSKTSSVTKLPTNQASPETSKNTNNSNVNSSSPETSIVDSSSPETSVETPTSSETSSTEENSSEVEESKQSNKITNANGFKVLD